jgi:chemotaxis protein MotA
MHVLVGLFGFAAALAATMAAEQSHKFTGFLHPPALLLLGIGPICAALVSYRPEELRDAIAAVARALRRPPSRARAELYDELTRFAAESRRGRPAEALAAADAATNPLLRQLAPLVVKQYGPDEIERTAAAASYCLASSLKRSEDVLTSLARVAPAVGLVGTTLGLISLLRDLSNFAQLGPSMALALLCTLYGLVLANAVYQPLARLVHAHSLIAAEEAKLLTRALALLAEGKPVADVRNLFDANVATAGLRVATDAAVG